MLVMGEFLTERQREELKYCHRIEDKLRYGDRIKAVLLLDSGWSVSKISEALLLNEKTIRNYKKLYEEGGVDRLCCDELKGSYCRISEELLDDLRKHLEENLYSTTAEIVAYIEETYAISYSISGMTDLLHRIGFVYKKTKIVPGKADPARQKEFLDNLEKLKESKEAADKVYYLDGVHPQHNSQAACGWILKGKEKKLKSNTGRKRINLNGALDADTHEVIIREDPTINAESTIALLKTLEEKNLEASIIYAIADNARYYKNKDVTAYLENSKIEILFLPPYAPNLNLIERLWKFFKKKTIYNRYYETFDEFKKACLQFFETVNRNNFRNELTSLLTNKFNIVSV